MKRNETRLLISITIVVGCTLMASGTSNGGPNDNLAGISEWNSAVSFLRTYLKRYPMVSNHLTLATLAETKEKNLSIAYITGQSWCGSSGCTLIILQPRADSYRVLGKIAAVNPPIVELHPMIADMPQIGFRVRGGGIDSPYEATLTFRDEHYEINSLVKIGKQTAPIYGRVLIGSGAGKIVIFN